MIKACTNGNLGDDLFVRIILERYKSSPIQFFLLVYKIEDYQYLLNEYPKLVLIKYPTPKMLLRILAKLQESLAHSSRLKQYGYEKAYHPLFDEKFDIFINIGGSQFTEYEGESFLLSLYLEELMIRDIKAKTMLLINVNFGPFVTEKYKEKCEAVFKKYSRIIFRDQYSAQLFSKISQVTYIPDIVLGFDFKKRIGEDITQEEMIGINVINLWENKRTYQERKKYIENYEKTIHAVIDYITKLKMKVCIIGFSSEKSEEIYINHIIACAKRRNPFVVIKKCIYNGKNINEVFRCIAECRGLLSTRFHALIIGMALGKCQYPICYDSKLTNFIKSINYTDPYSLLNDISSPEDIADYLIHGNPSDYKHVIDASKEHFTFMDLAIIE